MWLSWLRNQAAPWPHHSIITSHVYFDKPSLFGLPNQMGSQGFKTKEKGTTDCQPPTNTSSRFMYKQNLQVLEFSLWLSRLRTQLGHMRVRVRPLASFSGFTGGFPGSSVAASFGVGCRCSSYQVWLWHRLAAIALT